MSGFDGERDFSAIVRADLKEEDTQDNSLRPQFLADF